MKTARGSTLRVRLCFESWLAKFLRVEAIVLYPWIFVARSKAQTSRQLLCHEMIHVRQIRRIGTLRFYMSYVGEYFRHLSRGLRPEAAYLAISFEREAYAAQSAVTLDENELSELEKAGVTLR